MTDRQRFGLFLCILGLAPLIVVPHAPPAKLLFGFFVLVGGLLFVVPAREGKG